MKDKLTTIYIVRHGETEWNARKLLQGHKNIPLNENGANQARELARRFKNIHFDVIFSSDLLRARQTAEIVALERQMIVVTTKALREYAYGKYEGKKVEIFREELKEMFEKRNKLQNYEEKINFRLAPELETIGEVISRFINFIREIGITYSGKTALVVSHGGVIKDFLVHLGWADYSELDPHKSNMANTAYLILQTDGVDFFVREVIGVTKANNKG